VEIRKAPPGTLQHPILAPGKTCSTIKTPQRVKNGEGSSSVPGGSGSSENQEKGKGRGGLEGIRVRMGTPAETLLEPSPRV